MFKRVSPYIGEYKKYTVWATILMTIGIIANVAPYFFLYQIISPLTRGESVDAFFILIRVVAVAVFSDQILNYISYRLSAVGFTSRTVNKLIAGSRAFIGKSNEFA